MMSDKIWGIDIEGWFATAIAFGIASSLAAIMLMYPNSLKPMPMAFTDIEPYEDGDYNNGEKVCTKWDTQIVNQCLGMYVTQAVGQHQFYDTPLQSVKIVDYELVEDCSTNGIFNLKNETIDDYKTCSLTGCIELTRRTSGGYWTITNRFYSSLLVSINVTLGCSEYQLVWR
jgi:hypothetical protein